MAKKKSTIHPLYDEITIVTPSGEVFKTRSTCSKKGTLKLGISPKEHPAWTQDSSFLNTKSSHIADFNRKYDGLDFLGAASTQDE